MLQPFPGKHTRDFGHSCYALERMFLCSRWLVPLGLPMFNVYLVQLKARLRRPLAKKERGRKRLALGFIRIMKRLTVPYADDAKIYRSSLLVIILYERRTNHCIGVLRDKFAKAR